MATTNGKCRDSSTRFLPCKAEPGMFKGELLIFLEGLHPDRLDRKIKVQLLVDNQEVTGLTGVPKRKQPVSGWLQVSLSAKKGGIAEVVLPQPGQPVGTYLLVNAEDLKKEVRT